MFPPAFSSLIHSKGNQTIPPLHLANGPNQPQIKEGNWMSCETCFFPCTPAIPAPHPQLSLEMCEAFQVLKVPKLDPKNTVTFAPKHLELQETPTALATMGCGARSKKSQPGGQDEILFSVKLQTLWGVFHDCWGNICGTRWKYTES